MQLTCVPLSPPGLSVLQTSWGNVSHRGVFTDKCGIPRGARFGPFQGKLVNTSEIKIYDDNTLMWEVVRLSTTSNKKTTISRLPFKQNHKS